METTLVATELADHFRQMLDGGLLSRTNVNRIRVVVAIGSQSYGLGSIADKKEFARGRAGAPYFHFLKIVVAGLDRLANKGGDHMA